MYIFYDSDGIIRTTAIAYAPIEEYASPFEGLTALYLDNTVYADVQAAPLMYKVVNSVPVKQDQLYVDPPQPPQPPDTEERLTAVETAISALMGV